jgi:hypothetical protein
MRAPDFALAEAVGLGPPAGGGQGPKDPGPRRP